MKSRESKRDFPPIEQGLQLLRAHLAIKDPAFRGEILALALAFEERGIEPSRSGKRQRNKKN